MADVFVKDVTEIKLFASSIQSFSNEYISGVNNVSYAVNSDYKRISWAINQLELKLQQAIWRKRAAEQELEEYLNSCNKNKDEHSVSLDYRIVNELEDRVREAEEHIARAKMRLEKGERIAHTAKRNLYEIQEEISPMCTKVFDRVSNAHITIVKAAENISKYVGK